MHHRLLRLGIQGKRHLLPAGQICGPALSHRPGAHQPFGRPVFHLDLIMLHPVGHCQFIEIYAGQARRLKSQLVRFRALQGSNGGHRLRQQLGVVFHVPVPGPQGQSQQHTQTAQGQHLPALQPPPHLGGRQPQGVPQQLLFRLLPPLSRQQLGHRQPQAVPQGLQQGQVRKIQAPLPLAHRLGGHVESLGELLLGQPPLPPCLGDQRPCLLSVHGLTSRLQHSPWRLFWQTTCG